MINVFSTIIASLKGCDATHKQRSILLC